MESSIGIKLSEDHWFVYNILFLIFPLLDLPDILRCSEVCKLWLQVAKDSTFWHSVNIMNCKVDFNRMTEVLVDTVHLKLINCQFIFNAKNKSNGVKQMQFLRTIEASECSSKLIQVLTEETPNLEVIRANIICGLSGLQMDLSFIFKMPNLYELKLYINRELLNFDELFSSLGNLRHLYLLGVKHLDFQRIFKVNTNSTLETLALGDCQYLSENFVAVLKSLTALKKLRLENCIEWDVVPILKGVSEINSLVCLELVEIYVPQEFATGLKYCNNVEKLTIVPSTHRFNMALFNSRVIMAAIQLRSSLKQFTLGFSERYVNYFRKVFDVERSVPVLESDDALNRFGGTLVQMDDLENEIKEVMINTKVSVTTLVNTGRLNIED